MATTEQLYTGNGTTTLFTFPFEYITKDDVKVSLDGVDTTAYTYANATTIQMNTAPAGAVQLRIYRQTNVDDLKATFFSGSAIRAQDLNDNFLQSNYAVQEIKNRFLDRTGDTMSGELDMGTNKIVNVGTPTASADAATKAYVDGVAIAGIGTGTARQLLQTNAGATAVEFTSNIDIPGTLDVTGVATFDSDVTIASTGALTIPDGTEAQRPTGVTGMIRFNTDITQFEGYNGSSWSSIGGGATGGGNDAVFLETDNTVTTDYTLTTNKNAVTAGPITINSGITVTVPSGQSWVIV
jgi:hypothetical protein